MAISFEKSNFLLFPFGWVVFIVGWLDVLFTSFVAKEVNSGGTFSALRDELSDVRTGLDVVEALSFLDIVAFSVICDWLELLFKNSSATDAVLTFDVVIAVAT